MSCDKLILSILTIAFLFAGCAKQNPVADIPDQDKDKEEKPVEPVEPVDTLASYKTIKEYAMEYLPDMKIGLGLGADIYLDDSAYRKVADENFQLFTTGNAMKHSSVVRTDGTLNFSLIDRFVAAVPADIDIYGHNFIWHTQQKQQYLKSLIAPEIEGSAEDLFDNLITNSGFEDGTSGWTGFWGKFTYDVEQPGYNSDNAIRFTISQDCQTIWEAQLFWTLEDYLVPGETYCYEFYAKSDSSLECQFLGQNASYDGIYLDTFVPGTDWAYFSGEFTLSQNALRDIERIGLQFGGDPGSKIWFDDFKFGKKKSDGTAPTYIYKTAQEKKTILLGAMESWIRQMAEHLGDRVVAWDVINEPIADGSNAWRGIDNVFNGKDTAPVEDNGLKLNWESDHWYWGYYIGKEYAVKAFEYARKYCAEGAKLYVNDYNLEVSPAKLKAIIDFVKYIDENNSTGGPLVDGIGTQMHVRTSIRKDQVDAMFKTMAATGKLVRITELDVAVGSSYPTQKQLLEQAETYKMIVESYKENVPKAQQSGITVWTLSDNPAEHEYWLKGDAPNLFDANYDRKLAYKYFCDALAGKNLADDID